MKRILSVILSLIMAFGLFGVMGSAALAEETAGLTIVYTGGLGGARESDGLSFASVAALRDYFTGEVLVVDAGGFDAANAGLMSAVGYDLAVLDTKLDGLKGIALDEKELEPGAMFSRGGLKVAFIGIAPIDETNADDEDGYYAAVQKLVDSAAGNDADYIIALGSTDDTAELLLHVTGLDAYVTYGVDVAGVKEEFEAAQKDAGDEEPAADGEAEDAEPDEGEEEKTEAAMPVIASVDKDFGMIGVLKLKEDGLSAQTLNIEEYSALGLTESEELLALLDSEPASDAASDSTEDGEKTDGNSEADGETKDADEKSGEADGDADGQTTESGDGSGADDTGETEDGGTGDESKVVHVEKLPDDDGTEPVPEQSPAPDGEDGENAGDEAKTDENAGEDGEKTDEDGENAGDETKTDEDGEKTDEEVPLASDTDAAAEVLSATDAAPGPIEWKRGSADLTLDFEHPVSSIEVNGQKLESQYYTLSNDQKTVTLLASVLNGWGGDGDYNYYHFTVSFADGSGTETRTVNISGDKPAANAGTGTDKTSDPGAGTAAASSNKPVTKVASNDDEIAAAWKNEGLDPEVVKNALNDEIVKKSGFTTSNVKYYDVTATLNGAAATAQDITAAGGVTVTLPYPAGTNAENYAFVVAHRKADGTVEIFEIGTGAKTASGIQLMVTSLSPFAVAWKSVSGSAAPAAEGPGAHRAGQESPATGDTTPIWLFVLIFVVLIAAVVVVILLIVRQKKNGGGQGPRGQRELPEDDEHGDADYDYGTDYSDAYDTDYSFDSDDDFSI